MFLYGKCMKLYFELTQEQFKSVEEVFGDFTVGLHVPFVLNEKVYYVVGPQNAEEEDFVNAKFIKGLSKTLKLFGCSEISKEDFEEKNKEFQENNKQSLLNKLNEKEKLVFEESNKFIKDNNITDVKDKAFIHSLRKSIVSGLIVDSYSLEEFIENKSLDVSPDVQAMVEALVVDLAVKVADLETPKVKENESKEKFVNTKKYKQTSLF